MMYLKKLKIGNTGKRIVLVEMKFGTCSPKTNEHYFLVGELPHYDDDSTIRLQYDLEGTVRFKNEEEALNAYNHWGK